MADTPEDRLVRRLREEDEERVELGKRYDELVDTYTPEPVDSIPDADADDSPVAPPTNKAED